MVFIAACIAYHFENQIMQYRQRAYYYFSEDSEIVSQVGQKKLVFEKKHKSAS